MYVKTTVKQHAAAGEVVCQVDIVDGVQVLATGTSVRSAYDARTLREHTTYAALEAVRNLELKAKNAKEAVLEFLHGSQPK